MPAAIPIIAAVAAGAAAAAEMYVLAAVITIAASVASMALTKKQSASGSYRDQSERKQVLRAAASPKVAIYGETLSAGTLFFSEEEPGDQEKGEKLYLAITLAGHPLSGISEVWLADELIHTYGEHAEYEFHNNRTTTDPYLLANAPSWKGDMIGRGIAWIRLTLKFDAEKFPSGIPNVKVKKRGWAVYDPRTGGTAYSNNAALVILHFYRHYLNVPDSDILWEQFQVAANICDETVTNGDGTTEKRYTINGEFDLNENKSTVLDEMLASCAGDPTFIGGRHGLLVGAYYGPATDVISESQIAGDIEIMPEVAQRERVNIIKGTFIDPEQGYTEADFPSVSVEQWLNEDGYEIAQDMKLRFVTSEFQAQRLADIKLKRTRTARTMNLPMNLSGFRYRPGMYVFINLPSIGISNVEMRVTDWKFGAQSGVTLTVKQESSGVWNDAIGQPLERPPLTGLPIGGVAQPQALTYTVEEVGEVVQGVLSWQNTGTVAYNQVAVKQNGSPVLSVQVPGNLTRLTGLIRGTYTAHVTAVNFMGARSPEAWLEFVIDAPDAPSSVRVEQGFFAITLFPQMRKLTNVSTQFDFWTSGEKQLADSSTYTVENNATRMGVGTNWSSHGLQNDHIYYWYIRSINAFGASAFVEVAALCRTETGSLMDYINQGIRESGAFQNMEGVLQTSIEAVLQEGMAMDASVEHQWAQYGEVRADVIHITTTIANVEEAFAEYKDFVQAKFDDTTATLEQKMTASVKSDGTATTFYDLGLQIVHNDVVYKTGMSIGLEPSGTSYRSTIVFAADQFGIYAGNDPKNWQAAFFVYNGQVFIRSAFIQDASIDFAKISDTIQSTNFVTGVSGWRIPKSGNPEFNNGTFRGTLYATEGRFALSGTGNKTVIDGNGVTVNLTSGGVVRVGTWG